MLLNPTKRSEITTVAHLRRTNSRSNFNIGKRKSHSKYAIKSQLGEMTSKNSRSGNIVRAVKKYGIQRTKKQTHFDPEHRKKGGR